MICFRSNGIVDERDRLLSMAYQINEMLFNGQIKSLACVIKNNI